MYVCKPFVYGSDHPIVKWYPKDRVETSHTLYLTLVNILDIYLFKVEEEYHSLLPKGIIDDFDDFVVTNNIKREERIGLITLFKKYNELS